MNIGDLAKPAVVLIEKVSEAVGGIFKPWQIKRVAAAEAEANLTKTQNRMQVLGLEERALKRLIKEETKKQENIEALQRSLCRFFLAMHNQTNSALTG